jgi:hypothetical protein
MPVKGGRLFGVSTISGACVLCVLVRRLNRVSWVHRGLVEIAVGHLLTACYEIRAVVCSLPRASLLAGARFGLLSRGLPGLARNPFTLHDILRRRSSFCIRLG